MEEPVYVCKDQEFVLVPRDPSIFLDISKKVMWIIIIGFVAASIICRKNLFSELSWEVRVLLIVIAITVFFIWGAEKDAPFPIEIWFYDDYMIVYREKNYYSRRLSKQEFYKFYYKDIHRIEYRLPTKKIAIYGVGEFTWYDYKKDGSLPDTPTYDRRVDSICSFYKADSNTVDYVSLFEKYTPIKVQISDV